MGDIRLTRGGLIAGKWLLVRRIGQGGMGEVWLATHQTLWQAVAIKILDRDAFTVEVADEARSRFDLEARIAAKLARKTRHIVTVVDNGRDGDVDYLVMELLEGETLEERLASGPLEPMLAVDIVRQAARGLAFAHAEEVVHRDLKPSNLYLTTDEHGERLVKLLDFGIAKARHDDRDGPPSSHATRAGTILGTAQYMSPEQARGLAIDARADVWALAAVAYELLTGRPPFEGQDAVDLLMKICTTTAPSPLVYRPSLPSAVEVVFARAFARSIDARFSDPRAFADALGAALDTQVFQSSRALESIACYVATQPVTPPREYRSARRPLRVGVGVGVASLVALLAMGFALRSTPPAVAAIPVAHAARPMVLAAEPAFPTVVPAVPSIASPGAIVPALPEAIATSVPAAAPSTTSAHVPPRVVTPRKPVTPDRSEIL